MIGPLGKAFAYPKRLTNCLLVAEGHAAAPIYLLAQELLARHKRVDMIVGGETLERVFKPIEAKRLSQTVTIMTADGSLGERGSVLDALPAMAETSGGRGRSTRRRRRRRSAHLAEFCVQRKIPAQVLVEERMGCGFGLCQTCVVPVARKDGTGYDHVRSCIDGPVFNPARVSVGSVVVRGAHDVADAARRSPRGALMARLARGTRLASGTPQEADTWPA